MAILLIQVLRLKLRSSALSTLWVKFVALGVTIFIDGMSVLNAVAISGGFTYRANTKNIEVIRSGADGNAMIITPTSQVMPGDIIRVKERFF